MMGVFAVVVVSEAIGVVVAVEICIIADVVNNVVEVIIVCCWAANKTQRIKLIKYDSTNLG